MSFRVLAATVLAPILLLACTATAPVARTAPANPSNPPAKAPRQRVAAACELAGMREAILQRVNAVRARGRDCGRQRFTAARPLAWNSQLFSAAAGHSRDMAEHDYFSHESLRGTRPFQRAQAAGYRWRSVGENIAAGNRGVDDVMSAWLASEGHCENIMNSAYTEVAVACVERPGTVYGTYWTMMLGRR